MLGTPGRATRVGLCWPAIHHRGEGPSKWPLHRPTAPTARSLLESKMGSPEPDEGSRAVRGVSQPGQQRYTVHRCPEGPSGLGLGQPVARSQTEGRDTKRPSEPVPPSIRSWLVSRAAILGPTDPGNALPPPPTSPALQLSYPCPVASSKWRHLWDAHLSPGGQVHALTVTTGSRRTANVACSMPQ